MDISTSNKHAHHLKISALVIFAELNSEQDPFEEGYMVTNEQASVFKTLNKLRIMPSQASGS